MKRGIAVLVATLGLSAGCGAIPSGTGSEASATATPIASSCGGSPPARREAPSAAFDTDQRVVVVFGGDVNGSSVAETWQYGAGCWSQSRSTIAPAARQSAALVYDPDVHKLLLLGGRNDDPKGPQTIPGDVWTSDGQSWSKVPGAPRFADATAAYDEARHVVVVLGSAPEGTGTWTWDGIRWTYMSGQGPFLRLNPAMCFDSITKSVMLFGGAGSGVPVLGDTWLWNGMAWVQQHPAHNPPARFEAALACGQQPIMYGGWGDYQGHLLVDSWTWDGVDWQQLHPSHGPAPKPVMFGIFDGTHQIVFAGMSPGEIWTWSGSDWASSS